MHGGWLHIGSNMLFLFIFGDNVEDNMGSVKYLIFYLLCGFAADLTQFVFGSAGINAYIPNLGASGAIAGVLGAYLILFRQARIRALIPLGYFMTVARVPAVFMLGIWIATQFLSVVVVGEQEPGGGGGGVAYFAHIGGFLAGLVLVFIFRSRNTQSSPMFGT
jgi:membrane associated rhomboid family serine protease